MKVSSIILTAAIFLIAASVFAEPVTFTVNTTIGCSEMTYEGYDVTVSGCELTVVCLHSFNSLTVINSGTVTHVSGDPQGLNLTITTDVSVSGWCSIHANGRGYGSASGPGAGVTGTEGGGGGAYGGDGGKGCCAASGGIGGYGDIAAPTSLGSGGGNTSSYGQPGGAGGGAIHLVIGGTLTNDGAISATGINGDGNRSGGGSGGSIYISAITITGGGTIAANGGNTGGWGGGGGGGRIALHYDTLSYTGGITACGGAGWPTEIGGAGTIYVRDMNDNHVDLYASNCGNGGAYARLATLPPADNVYIQGATQVLATSALNVSGNLSVVSATVWTPAEQSLEISVGGNATVGSWSYLRATGLGYGSASGPGAGATGTEGGGGGAYGGNGGAGAGAAGGIGNYGSAAIPGSLGSGGGNTLNYGQPGGAGGGAIHLVIGGTLTNDGLIDASGINGDGNRSGGGSGGSIFISATSIAGIGTISANGGSTGGWGGGGGGGRIALYYDAFSYTGGISACGGAGWPVEVGGGGTIFVKPAAAPVGDLTISNCGVGGGTTLVSTIPLCNLFVQGSALVEPDTSLNVAGGLTIRSNAVLRARPMEPLTVNVGDNVLVDSWCAITADMRGHPSATGEGAGETGLEGGGGGGYGGHGGNGWDVPGVSWAEGGEIYGYWAQPYHFGSGGGNNTMFGHVGGYGGGAIRLTAGSSITVHGSISAGGGNGEGNRSGGGAGGSIWLSAPTLAGSGIISVTGGNTGNWGGGGGAGRIALYTCSNLMNSNQWHAGPGGGVNPGTPGSIYTGAADCNENGIADACDILSGTSADCDGNGVPDECQIMADCNSNGFYDFCDIANGTSADCNMNSIPDECDLADGAASDCNNNGAIDSCDIAGGSSSDCNANGVPDECEFSGDEPVLTVQFAGGHLILRWTCVPGFDQYAVYGKHGNEDEVLLGTVSGASYDATALLSQGGSPDEWLFHVHGENP